MTQDQMKKVSWLLIIAVITAGAMVPGLVTFPWVQWDYLFYAHFILLCTGYYLGLRGRGYSPFRYPRFYIMLFASLLPIIGPIAVIKDLAYRPNVGEQPGPASKLRTSLVSVAYFILIIEALALISLPVYVADMVTPRNRAAMDSARNHIGQADVLKKEGKSFSGEVDLAREEMSRVTKIMLGEKDEARKALLSGDILRLEGRYEKAEKKYKEAEAAMPEEVKERLARLEQLKKGL